MIKETTDTRPPENDIPAAGEEAVTAALLKHGFLTEKLIQRNLYAYGHRTVDTGKSLRKMQRQGKLERYTMAKGHGSDSLCIYSLPWEIRQKQGGDRHIRYSMTDVPYILEHLSVSQWEIALLKRRNVKECLFDSLEKGMGRLVNIPCLHRFKEWPWKDMHLLAVPVCRTDSPEGLKRFLSNVEALIKYLEMNSGRYRAPQIVIICESVRQIEDTCRLMARIVELGGYYFLYTTDLVTAEEGISPTDLLYGADITDEGNVDLSVYSLRSGSVKETFARTAASVKNTLDGMRNAGT